MKEPTWMLPVMWGLGVAASLFVLGFSAWGITTAANGVQAQGALCLGLFGLFGLAGLVLPLVDRRDGEH